MRATPVMLPAPKSNAQYVVPDWPNAVDQTDAIIGTIVRTKPNSNGKATAGVVSS